jgi:pimeloyl-ACP methyl ester carboxylesterase
MAQHHYHPQELSFGKKTSALWARTPNRRLILFVHGFGGTSTGTWLEFPGLLPASEKARNADIIFYGYDGLKTRAYVSAVELLDVLNRLATTGAGIVNATLPIGAGARPAAFAWDEITIIAHSLGCVVSRLALVLAHRRGDAWVKNVRLIFFAPAHSGANVLKLASEALTGIPGLMPLAKFRYKVLQDLEPPSETLKYLREEVQKALPAATYLSAKAVFLAGDDSVVDPLPCGGGTSPPTFLFAKRSHIEICKPSAAFPDPLTVLEEVL